MWCHNYRHCGRLDSIVGRSSQGNDLRVMCRLTFTRIVVNGVANFALFKINSLTDAVVKRAISSCNAILPR